MDTGVDADEEWLCGKRVGPAFRTVLIEIAGTAVVCLGGEQFHLEIYDLLLFFGVWPCAVPLHMDDGGVDRLVQQIAEERIRIITVEDFSCAGSRRRFPELFHLTYK